MNEGRLFFQYCMIGIALLWVIPFVVFFSVKMGTYAFLKAKYSFDKKYLKPGEATHGDKVRES
jgi:hypothetical protein